MLSYIEYLEQNMGLPGLIVAALVALFFILQVIGELLEFKGKVVPEFLKIRKFFQRRKKEKLEVRQTIQDVKKLLSDVHAHYSQDNITKRNNWMRGVNDSIRACDQAIAEIAQNLTHVTNALNANTKMTEGVFIQSSRDRILDFATKVSNEDTLVSREEFNRILKVYDEYEAFLKEHKKTNGEIDIAYRIINEAYAERLKTSTFIEDIRGYR